MSLRLQIRPISTSPEGSTGHYSFRRLDLHFGHSLFAEREGDQRRSDSILTTRFKISLSDKSASHAIPFYLEETIGGSDIDNEATLRAFKDYRFRGPNSFLVQEEFDRRIRGPVGLLLFYDAGKVTFTHSDINFSNMHQGFGGGHAFFTAGKVVFRAYVGLGGGEGAHPFFGLRISFKAIRRSCSCTDTGHFSFRRFETKLDHHFSPGKKKHGDVSDIIVKWKYSVSDANSGNAVPFCLQETLGGTDINNEPTASPSGLSVSRP